MVVRDIAAERHNHAKSTVPSRAGRNRSNCDVREFLAFDRCLRSVSAKRYRRRRRQRGGRRIVVLPGGRSDAPHEGKFGRDGALNRHCGQQRQACQAFCAGAALVPAQH